MLMDDDDDMLWRYIDEQNIYEGLTILQRSESVPNVAGYIWLCVSLLSFHIEILLHVYQHGRSALDTSRTLFLLASTQGFSCRLVMNHLIYVYVLSHINQKTIKLVQGQRARLVGLVSG